MAVLINATGCNFLLLHQASKYNQTKDIKDIKDGEIAKLEPMMDAGMDIKHEIKIEKSTILIYEQSPIASDEMLNKIKVIAATMEGDDNVQCIVPEYVAKAYANHIKGLLFIDINSAFTYMNHTIYTKLTRVS